MFTLFKLGLPPVSARTLFLLGLGLLTGVVGATYGPRLISLRSAATTEPMIVRTAKGNASEIEVFVVASLGVPSGLGTLPQVDLANASTVCIVRCRKCHAWSDTLRSMQAEGGEFLEVPSESHWHAQGCVLR